MEPTNTFTTMHYKILNTLCQETTEVNTLETLPVSANSPMPAAPPTIFHPKVSVLTGHATSEDDTKQLVNIILQRWRDKKWGLWQIPLTTTVTNLNTDTQVIQQLAPHLVISNVYKSHPLHKLYTISMEKMVSQPRK